MAAAPEEAPEAVSAASQTVSFVLGDCFDSFSAVEERLKKYKAANYVEFWKRDSRTIEAAQRRRPNKVIKSSLVYYELRYCCIHGGKPFQPKGKGIRHTS